MVTKFIQTIDRLLNIFVYTFNGGFKCAKYYYTAHFSDYSFFVLQMRKNNEHLT